MIKMKLADLVKFWQILESLDDELDGAQKGDVVAVPKVKGLKLNGERWTLKNAELEKE